MKQQLLRFLKQYGLITLVSSVLLLSLVIMSQILQNASRFADAYTTLLFFTFGGVGVLLFVLIKTLWNLRLQRKRNLPGVKITIRLTTMATLMLGIPSVIIFYFSLTFIQQGINQWFDVKTETALENASALVRTTLDNKTRDMLNLTLAVAKEKSQSLATSPILEVSKLRVLLNAQEVALYHSNQQLIAYSSEEITDALPRSPGDNLFQQIRQKKTYAAIEESQEPDSLEQFIRVIIPFSDLDLSGNYALQVLFPIPRNLSQLAESVAISTGQYKELSYLKGPLTTSFTLILSMVLLLTLLTAVLFTIQAAQNFTRPIRTLARGTKAVSQGDYTIKMPIRNNDEFGDLTVSFNDMIQRISKARNDVKLGHQQTEVQKLYLQAVIKNLSSGVLTLDMNLRIRTTNDSAQKILNTDLSSHIGERLVEWIEHEENAHLHELFTHITPLFKQGALPWNLQQELASTYGQKILMIHGSTLPSIDKKIGGYVLVIDDVTEMVQAQLNAAWSDVARRLAHEIKNPLTPIQLSAERLNYKLYDKLESEDQSLLSRMTNTIIEQVTTMQTLVQAFSDYANTPDVLLQKTDLNLLIKDVSEMYHSPSVRWSVQTELATKCPMVLADSARLRQLLHNLIKNAIEATETTAEPRIKITTICQESDNITLSICDNGPGIPEESQNWIFEPYASDKPKGTGLGLAIVRKIVEEHRGKITLSSSPSEGTCFIITFPVMPNEHEGLN